MGRRTKSFKAGSIEGTGRFGYGTHTPWEEFQTTISAPKYQKVITGTAYPRRNQFSSDDNWTRAFNKTEMSLKPKPGLRQTVY